MKKLAALALAIVIMLTVAAPVLAIGPQLPIERLEKRYTPDVAPYDRITGYCFNPTQDYNCDGVVNAGDCFIEFHHHQDSVSIVELGILYNWQGAEAQYQTLQYEGCGQGYNRYYSAEFYNLNLLVNGIYISGYSHYPSDTIDCLDYEALCQSQYPIVDYGSRREYDITDIVSDDMFTFRFTALTHSAYELFTRPVSVLVVVHDWQSGAYCRREYHQTAAQFAHDQIRYQGQAITISIPLDIPMPQRGYVSVYTLDGDMLGWENFGSRS